MKPTAHPRRRLEERLGLRFPRLAALLGRIVWRQPISRLRWALARRFLRVAWESFNRDDYEATFMLYHPDCRSEFPAEWGTIGVGTETESREERIRYQRAVNEAWSTLRFEPEESIIVDDRLLAVGRMRASGRGSGAPLDTEWVATLTIVDGRAVHERIHLDHAEALEAAGIGSSRGPGG
jgi:ketosteroid isomerase-like protein